MLNKLSKIFAVLACFVGATLGVVTSAHADSEWDPGALVVVTFGDNGEVTNVFDPVGEDSAPQLTFTSDDEITDGILISVGWTSAAGKVVTMTVGSVTRDGVLSSNPTLTAGALVKTGNHYDQLYALDLMNTAGVETVVTFAFTGPKNSSADVSAVPEPATMVLLGTGLAGLAGARRRRKLNAEKRTS